MSLVLVGIVLTAGASGANFGWPANQQLEHNRLQAKGMQLCVMLMVLCKVTINLP